MVRLVIIDLSSNMCSMVRALEVILVFKIKLLSSYFLILLHVGMLVLIFDFALRPVSAEVHFPIFIIP